MAAKIKKGDRVIVISGKHKGTQGEVIHCSDEGTVKISNVFQIKHVRSNQQKNIEGGIQKKEKPIHISNVAIFNTITKKADKVGFKFLEDGRKVRIYKSNNETIDV